MREASSSGAGRDELTRLLNEFAGGWAGGVEDWMVSVVAELRSLAGAQLRGKAGHTLQPTALVHEALLRIFGTGAAWNDRRHFFTLAARVMRQILVDHARGRDRVKRGAGRIRIALDERLAPGTEDSPDVLDLHEALLELTSRDELQGRIVELRFFGGLEVGEVAELLELSKSTIEREWRSARR